ncbi:hypothetical protein BHM03_00005260 [Ensete ventricosum]|nr:hypothetical protein BHM03_00005260 [Ensete ventricosum]
MDLLWNAYGVPSHQEEDTGEGQGQGQHRTLQRPLPAPKRFRSEAYVPPQSPSPPLVFPPEPSGRYVSKRERAILAAALAASTTASAPLPPPHLHPSTSVYTEAYTCTCVRYHPSDCCFVAQSNGNYIAIFSARPPFKMDKYKRYEMHGVCGFPINCNFSSDGEQIASGSSDGCIYFYSYKSSELLRKIKAFDQACIDVAFHPLIPDVVASCSWAGEISVFG